MSKNLVSTSGEDRLQCSGRRTIKPWHTTGQQSTESARGMEGKSTHGCHDNRGVGRTQRSIWRTMDEEHDYDIHRYWKGAGRFGVTNSSHPNKEVLIQRGRKCTQSVQAQ